MKRLLFFISLMFVWITAAQAAIVGEEVNYKADGTVMKGYLAYDDSIKDKRPGVLVVHEWWGHNPYARKRAKMLAELGYVALAVDMYGDGKQAEHPDEAGKFAAEVRENMPEARARFEAALKLLREQPTTDPAHIAAIGYCFGGGVVLEMARAGEPLDGVVSFHGSLGTAHPAAAGAVKTKIRVFTGADDPFVPPEQVAQFRQEMDAAGADYQVEVLPGAKHSFTNPDADALGQRFDLPLQYNAEADQKSWTEMQAFFQSIFK